MGFNVRELRDGRALELQGGGERAEYGKQVIETLSERLVNSRVKVYQMLQEKSVPL